jgi:hypothetical protein
MINGTLMNEVSSPFTINPELLSTIKYEVVEAFGRPIITSRDCIQLSEEIYFETSFRINPNTLRRFFGLVKADYPPSVSTLNILSKYCGFDSMDEVVTFKQRPKSNSLYKEEKGFLNYLIALFKSTLVKDTNDETFYTLVKHTINYLNQNPELASKFQRVVVKTKNGQEFYFEQFVNMDKLNSFYGEGLRYYINEKKTSEAQIFGNSLLCLRSWLTWDNAGLKRYFELIKKHNQNTIVQPFIFSKYYASHLYFADGNGLNTERILIDANNTYTNLKGANDNNRLSQSFEFAFSQALIFTRHYGEALFYINCALKNYPERTTDKGVYKVLLLYKAIALLKNGDKLEAEKIFAQLRSSQFYFLSKKTNSILYLLLASWLNKRNQKLEQQLKELIQETGFVRLQELT